MDDIDDRQIERDRLESAADRAQLVREIEFQFSVEGFIQGPLGRYLCARAEEERGNALEALATAQDMSAVVTLQQKIQVLDSWQGWLADAIHAGEQAQKQMVEQG